MDYREHCALELVGVYSTKEDAVFDYSNIWKKNRSVLDYEIKEWEI